MFEVFENNKPCIAEGSHSHDSWTKNCYETLEEAQDYANDWLGNEGSARLKFKVDEPLIHNGYGDTIEIRETTDFDVEKTIEWLHQLKTRQLEALLLATALQLTTREDRFDPIYEYLERKVLQ